MFEAPLTDQRSIMQEPEADLLNLKRMGQRKLKVGLLLDDLASQQWVYRIVEDIVRSSVAEIALIVINECPPEQGRKNLRWAFEKRSYLLMKAYSGLDTWLFKKDTVVFAAADLKPLIEGTPILHVRPDQTQYVDYLREDDIARIKSYQLDVAIRFGFRILKGDILTTAKHGIWSFHQMDNLVARGGPPALWEVMEGHPATGCVLQILTPQLDGGQVIYRSWVATHTYSVRRTREVQYRQLSSFIIRKLQQLYERGEAVLSEDTFAEVYRPYDHTLYKAPTNGRMVRLLARLGGRTTRSIIKNALASEHWFLACKKSREPAIAESFYNTKPITPPSGFSWRHPFPVVENGAYHVFLSEHDHRKDRSHIAVISRDREGNWSKATTVLEHPENLLYPFLFRWQDDWYMIPRIAGGKAIVLYRCNSFPNAWTPVQELLSGVPAINTTLAQAEGRWWMFFATSIDEDLPSDELHIYHADNPLGPWIPHWQNPVKSDVRSARPAGNLFFWKGELYRPAQDCSVREGYAIALNKITSLSPDRYREIEVSKLLPRWREHLTATSTLNHAAGLTVIDGCMRRSSLTRFAHLRREKKQEKKVFYIP